MRNPLFSIVTNDDSLVELKLSFKINNINAFIENYLGAKKHFGRGQTISQKNGQILCADESITVE